MSARFPVELMAVIKGSIKILPVTSKSKITIFVKLPSLYPCQEQLLWIFRGVWFSQSLQGKDSGGWVGGSKLSIQLDARMV